MDSLGNVERNERRHEDHELRSRVRSFKPPTVPSPSGRGEYTLLICLHNSGEVRSINVCILLEVFQVAPVAPTPIYASAEYSLHLVPSAVGQRLLVASTSHVSSLSFLVLIFRERPNTRPGFL